MWRFGGETPCIWQITCTLDYLDKRAHADQGDFSEAQDAGQMNQMLVVKSLRTAVLTCRAAALINRAGARYKC